MSALGLAIILSIVQIVSVETNKPLHDKNKAQIEELKKEIEGLKQNQSINQSIEVQNAENK